MSGCFPGELAEPLPGRMTHPFNESRGLHALSGLKLESLDM